KPDPLIFAMLDMLMIGDSQEKQAAGFKNRGIGTGPFKLQDWRPGEQATLVRNESYWRKDRPYLDEVQLKVAPDPTSLAVGGEAGAYDVIEWPLFQDYVRI